MMGRSSNAARTKSATGTATRASTPRCSPCRISPKITPASLACASRSNAGNSDHGSLVSAFRREGFMLTVDPHPLLDLRAFVTEFTHPLGELPTPPEWFALLTEDAAAPLHSDDGVREAVRALLRQGGFKPTGRSKPASEYLLKAVRDKLLSPINVAVDVCNVVSLHSGLPISVVDLDRAREPFKVEVAPPGSAYVFNASGQSIDLGGLLCLFHAEGPCGNPVNGAQPTKTTVDTPRTLSLVRGPNAPRPPPRRT